MVSVTELALAGTRAAWISVGHGNGEEQTLETASIGGRARAIGGEYYNSVGGLRGGTYIGGLAGAGDLIVANTWSQCDEIDVQTGAKDPSCAPGTPAWISNGKLVAVDPFGIRPILRGPSALTVADVERGLVAIRTGAHSVDVLDGSGGSVRDHYDLPGTVRGVALADTLIVLAKARLAAIRPGGMAASRPLGSAAGTRVLADASGSLGDAELTEAGLWYSAAASRAAGTVAFVPTARLRAALAS